LSHLSDPLINATLMPCCVTVIGSNRISMQEEQSDIFLAIGIKIQLEIAFICLICMFDSCGFLFSTVVADHSASLRLP
jgi:hypothetical protein